MAQFHARPAKKGFFEILGLEEFIEARLNEMKRAISSGFSAGKTSPVAAPTAQASKSATAKTTKVGAKVLKPVAAAKRSLGKSASTATTGNDDAPVQTLLSLMEKHPKKIQLAKVGASKDQLLRSLIPLYLAKGENMEMTSGVISRFWKQQGINYAAPNAAKALRKHPGYSKDGQLGKQIAPNGIRYVETALKGDAKA